jgi:hypothetical protein
VRPDSLFDSFDEVIGGESLKKARRLSSETSKVPRAVDPLLLRAQQLDEYPRLSPRELVDRISPRRQVNEAEVLEKVHPRRTGGPDTAEAAVKVSLPLARKTARSFVS